ncbi:MAG: hypothetical protein ACF8Q5_01195 [Phycisphaerales bacterium JB040]
MIRRLTRRLIGMEAPGKGPTVTVAVFGKHPGWADHMDEIGLDTPGLIELRQTLYKEAVGRNIDLGTWEKLSDEDRLERFDHEFVYRSESGSLIAGRMWSSTDGRGRSKYPMIVCVETSPAFRAWLMFEALPELARAQERFVGAKTAEEVRSLHASLSDRVSRGAEGARAGDDPDLASALRELADSGIGGDRESILRVVYASERDLGLLLGRMPPGSQSSVAVRAGSIRVPRLSGGLAEGLWRWSCVYERVTPRRMGLMVIGASGRDWADVVLGRGGADAWECVRTNSSALPIVSEIPYTIDPSVRDRLRGILS